MNDVLQEWLYANVAILVIHSAQIDAPGFAGKPDVVDLKILKFDWSPGHSANILLCVGKSV